MKKLVASILPLAVAALLGAAAFAQEATHGEGAAPAEHEEGATPHYPLKHPREQDWSFAGPFGHYDKGQLQRGLKVYTEVCSACHSMSLVPFRMLGELGYSEAQVKAFAANYDVQDGPDSAGEMFTRKAIPSDHFPSPYANAQAAAAANNGAAPPDFSLIAKARGITRGFPQFVFDIFTQYQEGGPDYIYSLLTGYEEPPAGFQVPEGAHYNPYFNAAAAFAMPKPLSDDQVTYDDGTPQTVDQYSKDVSAFLMWAAEPHLEERKSTGFMVIVFLLIFSGLIFLTKRSVYANKEH
ncbi:cytochrome c1 [Rhizobium mongolense]|uniref:Cytochrome c1 n=1 Tax=Rhizobium mongolense TaxID=57676 RepID=A0A7W6RIC9_9HYPH|nr:cytochrome c1 [Rhizobium mongolense]MBB4272493.1 ubiquinol-cytochrome c reductase cytochrome c1 subunit [Rhizobium mongolense]